MNCPFWINIQKFKRSFLSSDLARAKLKNRLSGLFLKPCKKRLIKPIPEIQNQFIRP